MVSQGCPSEGPAVWAIRWDCFPKTCVNRSTSCSILAACPNHSLVKEVRGLCHPPECVSQWGDEASYGNLNSCQPTRSPNLGGCGSKTRRRAGSAHGAAARESVQADKKAVFCNLEAIPIKYAPHPVLVRVLRRNLQGIWIWVENDSDSPSIHRDRRNGC